MIEAAVKDQSCEPVRHLLDSAEVVVGYRMIKPGAAISYAILGNTFSAMLLHFAGASGLSFSYGMNVSTAVYIIQTLQHMRQSMSARTFQLQRQLSTLLLVQVISNKFA